MFKKLSDGANRFFGGNLSIDLHTSYEVWYSEISFLMENRDVYMVGKFLFVKKQFKDYFDSTKLVLVHENANFWENQRVFVVGLPLEKMYWQRNKDAKFSLLHPKLAECRLVLEEKSQENAPPRWSLDSITKDYYFGKRKSMILFGQIE